MSQAVTLNGVGYTIPETREKNWGNQVTTYLVAISQVVLQKSGGSFALTADVDFGASYGLKSAYYSSRSATPASAGNVRLGNTETVSWRDSGNSDDLDLKPDASNDGQILFNDIHLNPLTTDGDIMVFSSGDNARLPVGSNGQVLIISGGVPTWGNVGGTGDVVGPGSSTDNTLARFDSTTGKIIQGSGIVVDDSNNVSAINNLSLNGVIQDNLLADSYETLGDTSNPWQAIYLDNDATDGGAVYFNASSTSYLKSSTDGLTLDIGGFTAITSQSVQNLVQAMVEYDQKTPAIINSYNVASVTDTTAGRFTVVFDNDLDDYYVSGIPRGDSNQIILTHSGGTASDRGIRTYDDFAGSLADCESVFVMFVGKLL